jgi:hypothetical protein
MGWPLYVGQEVWSFRHEIDKHGIGRIPGLLDVGSIDIGDGFEDLKRRSPGINASTPALRDTVAARILPPDHCRIRTATGRSAFGEFDPWQTSGARAVMDAGS